MCGDEGLSAGKTPPAISFTWSDVDRKKLCRLLSLTSSVRVVMKYAPTPPSPTHHASNLLARMKRSTLFFSDEGAEIISRYLKFKCAKSLGEGFFFYQISRSWTLSVELSILH